MAQRQPYDDQTKAQCLAMLLAGQTIQQVAAQTGVSRRTLSYWKSDAGMTPTVNLEDRAQIGVLILGFLSQTLESLAEQQRLFGDPEWLREQGAAELATLHGVSTDKALRLLEAMVAVPEQDEG